MLAIRMQRTGRKGHAMFRMVVQDSHRTPTSGKVVAPLGSYDPHAKTLIIDKEKAAFYLQNGAQPSERAARLLKSEGVKLPKWVKEPTKHERTVRNAEKRRSTAPAQPKEEAAPDVAEPETAAPEEAAPAEAPAAEEPSEEPSEEPATEAPTEEPAAEPEDTQSDNSDQQEEPPKA
ncbi:MAG TPA: 30S ribosomal protein S16 [Verrucomicrobiae bacterium]|nr:30S ribosomal protein S16 [Verrucomicrobiae bacterium]